MFPLCLNSLKNRNLFNIKNVNGLIPTLCSTVRARTTNVFSANLRRLTTSSSSNSDHEPATQNDSLIDTLIELNYKENTKHSPGWKLRLLNNIVIQDKNYEISYSNHVSSLLLEIWNSRDSLSRSELSLYDKICHQLSQNIWKVLPSNNRRFNTRLHYHQLKYELKALHEDVLSPTPCQYRKKEDLINYLKPLFESTINGTLHTFGSCDNGLWSRGSDIDLCLMIPNCNSKRYMMSKLNLVKACLSNSDLVSKVSIISARVPIVKLYDMEGNNICDVSINNCIALHNSEYVKTMCKLDERVVLMGRFIKYWASCRKINNRAEGTMSSYTLILQLFYFLQNRDPPIIPTLKEIEITQSTVSTTEGNNDNDCNMNNEDNDCKDNADDKNNEGSYQLEKNKNDTNHQNKPPDDGDPNKSLKTEGVENEGSQGDLVEGEGVPEEYNYLTNQTDILNKCTYLGKNKEDVVSLLLGFFEFYSHERFRGGRSCSTIDMYNNEILENTNGSLIVKCPLSRKNVNPFTIRMWQSIYGEFKRANDLLKLNQPFKTICQEVHLSPLEEQTQQHQLNQQKLFHLFK